MPFGLLGAQVFLGDEARSIPLLFKVIVRQLGSSCPYSVSLSFSSLYRDAVGKVKNNSCLAGL
jgi:hypothetical protein